MARPAPPGRPNAPSIPMAELDERPPMERTASVDSRHSYGKERGSKDKEKKKKHHHHHKDKDKDRDRSHGSKSKVREWLERGGGVELPPVVEMSYYPSPFVVRRRTCTSRCVDFNLSSWFNICTSRDNVQTTPAFSNSASRLMVCCRTFPWFRRILQSILVEMFASIS